MLMCRFVCHEGEYDYGTHVCVHKTLLLYWICTGIKHDTHTDANV